jgi:hypothetical protein
MLAADVVVLARGVAVLAAGDGRFDVGRQHDDLRSQHNDVGRQHSDARSQHGQKVKLSTFWAVNSCGGPTVTNPLSSKVYFFPPASKPFLMSILLATFAAA